MKGQIMGFNYRHTTRIGRNTRLNVSGRGAAVSQRIGRVSVSSRGTARVRLGRGFSFRFKL